MNEKRIPTVLSIAGSDSGGGAGIQADLKAFAACGVHGMTAITAITAQNTVGVIAVGTTEAIEAVVACLALMVDVEAPIVVDPVMVAESGAPLLDAEAHEALAVRLLPMATVVTPNLPEARILAEQSAGPRIHSGVAEPSAEPTAPVPGPR